jgi:retron-type reverse transcriptase
MQLELFNQQPALTLIEELFQAYFDCRRNKRNTINALKFEIDFESQVFQLKDDLASGIYQPGKSITFIVNKPVKREVFAADFRDRVVHHYLINKVNFLFEKLFIKDSYACRVGKGTHYGIKRINEFIKKCSNNYREDAWVLKLDLSGFFMSINRVILFNRLEAFLRSNYFYNDIEFVVDVFHKVVFADPAANCIVKGSKKDWQGLPQSKSLFYSKKDCGLPIGNLTSQILANFYLHELDNFVIKNIKCNYYGRYVDDFILVYSDKNYLKNAIVEIRNFLKSELELDLHPRKIYFQHYTKGVKFLGVFILPNRIYVDKRLKNNFHKKVFQIANCNDEFSKPKLLKIQSAINSYLGMMIHYNSYNLRKLILTEKLPQMVLSKYDVSSNFSKILISFSK